jgi:hypothetical protein
VTSKQIGQTLTYRHRSQISTDANKPLLLTVIRAGGKRLLGKPASRWTSSNKIKPGDDGGCWQTCIATDG